MHTPAHQYGALRHPTVLRLSEQVYFPPLVHMGNLSVFMKVVCERVCVVCVCGSVNFSSADTLVYPLYICICTQYD